MIRDHMRIWLLRPGFTLEQFGKLPILARRDRRTSRSRAIGERWLPIEGSGGWKVPGLHGDGQVYEPLGAIHLPHELVMLFEDDLVASPAKPEIERPRRQQIEGLTDRSVGLIIRSDPYGTARPLSGAVIKTASQLIRREPMALEILTPGSPRWRPIYQAARGRPDGRIARRHLALWQRRQRRLKAPLCGSGAGRARRNRH